MAKTFEADLSLHEGPFRCGNVFVNEKGEPRACMAKCVLVNKATSGGKRDLLPMCPRCEQEGIDYYRDNPPPKR